MDNSSCNWNITEGNILRSTEILARAVADRVDARIVTGASTTSVSMNPLTLNLPALAFDDKRVGLHVMSLIFKLSFEARFTDFGIAPLPDKGIFYPIWRVIEDVWTEHLGTLLYPGARVVRNEELTLLAKDININAIDSPAKMIAEYIHYYLRSNGLQQACFAEFAELLAIIMEQTFGGNVVTQIKAILDNCLSETHSTAMALKVTESIVSIFTDMSHEDEDGDCSDTSSGQTESDGQRENGASDNSEQPTGDESHPDRQDSDKSDPSDTQDSGTGESDSTLSNVNAEQNTGNSQTPTQSTNALEASEDNTDEPGNNGDSGPQLQDDGSVEQQGNPAGLGQKQDSSTTGESESSGKPDDPPKDGSRHSQAMNNDKRRYADNAREALLEELGEKDSLQFLTMQAIDEQARVGIQQQGYALAVPTANAPSQTSLDATLLISNVMTRTGQYRRRLTSLLQSSRRKKIRHLDMGIEFDTSKIVDVLVGEKHVFCDIKKRKGVNTRLMLLMDYSRSMLDNVEASNDLFSAKYRIAREVILGLGLTVDNMKHVDYQAALFNTKDHYGVNIDILTSFNESVRKTAGRYIESLPKGLTPLAHAIYWAYSELAKNQAKRNVLLVITDGAPCYKGGSYAAMTKDVIDRGIAAGVEIYGIGIGTMSVQELFEIYRIVHDINDLSPALFDLATDILRQAAA